MPAKKKKKRSSKVGKKPLSRSLRVYQKIAIVFVVLSFFLLLFVLYLSISKASIRVSPNPQVVSTQLSVDVVPEALTLGEVTGYVLQESFTMAELFELPEDGATAQEAQAGGVVTLINETANDQPLVATTRLLSEEGVLFRLEEGVTVPANGQVEAVAYADEAGISGEIGPSQFTIPGLAASLQDDIYAVSVDSMVGGVVYVRVLTQEDLDEAARQLEEQVLEEAETVLAELIDTDVFNGSVFSVDVGDRTSDTEPGAETGTFTVSVGAVVTGVFFDEDVMLQYASADLQNQLSANYELAEVNEDGLQLEIRSVDIASEQASLNLYLDGTAVVSPLSDVLNPERFLGRSPEEVVTLLEASELVESVSVTFTPFWLKRMPTLKDHIKIIVDY